MAGSALGARLAGRLTAELISRSPQYMNCCGDYHLDLRGNKIGLIENLGATENQFDTIDLTDNEIVKLEGFPILKRIKTLLLSNNRITRIAPSLQEKIPNLETLVLTGNRIANLGDLEPLAALPKLKHLSLMDCAVAKRADYRAYIVFTLKQLKTLDFQRVKPAEREAAEKLFGDSEKLAEIRSSGKKKDEEEEEAPAKDAPVAIATADTPAEEKKGPTPDQILAIKAAIANATTLDEVTRLEEALKAGVVPENGVAAMES